MRFSSPRLLGLVIIGLLTARPAGAEKLFSADSRDLPNTRTDIVITEIERRPRVSVLEIRTRITGSPVGASMFIACGLRRLAALRGQGFHIAKIEKGERMLVGFLAGRNDPPAGLGPDFAALRAPADVIDLESFAPLCKGMEGG